MDKPQNLEDYFSVLGCEVEDKVTGVTGIATSVSFDLYGCIQVIVNPGCDKENKQKDSYYYDFNRLKITDKKRVMPLPKFTAEARKVEQSGPEMKPSRSNIVKR